MRKPGLQPNPREHGFSVLATLAGMLLINITMLAVISSIKPFLRFSKEMTEHEGARRRAEVLRSVFQEHLDGSAGRHAFQGYAVHTGEIRDVHGRLHPVYRAAGASAPAAGASALSFLILDHSVVLRAVNREASQAGTASIVLCPGTALSPNQAERVLEIDSWIAAGIDGYIETRGRISRRTSSACSGAFQGAFSLLPAAIFGRWEAGPGSADQTLDEDKEAALLETAAVFFPVKESCTYYLSSAGILRRFAQDLDENQPVADGIMGLKLELQNDLAAGPLIAAELSLGKKGLLIERLRLTLTAPDRPSAPAIESLL